MRHEESLDISEFVEVLKKESQEIEKQGPFGFDNTKLANEYKKQKWYIHHYINDTIAFWNSNKLTIDSAVLSQNQYPVLYQFGDDVYCVFSPSEGHYNAFRIANDGVFHKRLYSHYSDLSNTTLKWDRPKDFTYDKNIVIELADQIKYRGYLFLFLISLILFLAIQQLTQKALMPKTFILGLAVLAALVAGLSSSINLNLKDLIFNNNSMFANLKEGNSILLLLGHFVAGASIILVVFQTLTSKSWIAQIIRLIIILFTIDLVIDLFRRIVTKSDISFDFEKLFGLSIHTFLAIGFMGLCLLLVWFLVNETRLKSTHNKGLAIATFVASFAYGSFQIFDGHKTLIALLIPIGLIVLALFAIPRIQKAERRNWAYFILSLFLISVIIQLSRQEREIRATQMFASTLIENNDPQAEIILQNVENKLAQEFLVPEDYANFFAKKELVENRIKRLYFSNYLEKYELKLLSFDSLGSNINQNNIYSYEDLDNIYNNSTKRTNSSYFYQITNPASFNGYIAKYENCDIDGHNGTTFILLQPRVVQSEFLYPEVFANQASEEMVNLDDYSYGIYFNNKLINQRGSFPYQLNSIPDTTNTLSIQKQYKHQLYAKDGYAVVLSNIKSGFRSWLSSFTFSLLLLLPLAILLAGICYFAVGKYNSFTRTFIPVERKYLSTRIQFSLTIILLFGLLFSVYIIINYIRSNYNENLENQLLTTVKNIGSQFQNKVDLEKKLYQEEERLLILNEESSAYKVDINLFNKNGKLLSSTKPYLLENEIVGDLMNPQAYSLLRLENNSQLLIQEELEGSEYLSAYVPLFNGKNHVIGYLNTPYFAKNEELNKQISSLVVNIINIYFLLLLGASVLAYIIAKRISKPLLLVQEKMSKTDLGSRNELISYHREDEIGQLVKQYNKMVMQLDESANQLAESEREGAWREMAKQVAHEIKNPLTPMKLSIQHLQRAYDAGSSDKLDALFAKTSKLLVDQIESLSNMASEFSNFAKMPEKEYEVFNISETLKETVHLFEQSENVHFMQSIAPNVLVNADPEQVKRVFNNLIKNAIQAIPDGRVGEINVVLRLEENTVLITVKDNGLGIPENIKKRVFVPNFSTKNSGMGLGLAICKKIIEAADGKIRFESEANKGTTFKIELPYAEPN